MHSNNDDTLLPLPFLPLDESIVALASGVFRFQKVPASSKSVLLTAEDPDPGYRQWIFLSACTMMLAAIMKDFDPSQAGG
jgi:hypothetical protein